MRYQNHIRGQEILDDKLKGNVAVITGANRTAYGAPPRQVERGRINEFNTCYSC